MPSFWRWQGVLREGQDIHALTAHLDFFPTFVELAGAAVPEGTQKLDGRSLLPLLADPNACWDDRYLFVHKGRWEKGAEPNESKYSDCAVRSERFRLVNNEALYDIDANPGESANVIDQHPEAVRAMRAAYDAWWAETRPLMVNEEVPKRSCIRMRSPRHSLPCFWQVSMTTR